ncbi:MAG: hypothetical protein JNL67_12635 [Planctomycetaceae bacterium]|nr:hypothetical protein [Planctomycetaceae bacterium]
MGLLVLNVDHLPPHLLGPYGNTSVPTPTLNAWAARGLTADAVFHSGWSDSENAIGPLHLLRRRADLWLSPSKDGRGVWPRHTFEIESEHNLKWVPVKESRRLAKNWEGTALASYLERALSQWTEAALPHHAMVWLDVPLLSGTWDAPLEWRSYLAGDEDPEVYSELEPPYLVLPGEPRAGLHIDDGFDPDLRMGYEHAAGSMIMLLDQACEWLQNCVAALPGGRDHIIVLTADSGFSLGEHLGIGSFPDRTWSEETQVPLLLYVGAAAQYPVRIPTVESQHQLLNRWLTMTKELHTSLYESAGRQKSDIDYVKLVEQSLPGQPWFRSDAAEGYRRHAVVSQTPNQIAIRTQCWSFVWKVSQQPQLFVRPDDRFEQNDVVSRCPELVAHIQWYLPELLAEFPNSANRQLPEFLFESWCRTCEALAEDGRAPEEADWPTRLHSISNRQLRPLAELPEILWAEVT